MKPKDKTYFIGYGILVFLVLMVLSLLNAVACAKKAEVEIPYTPRVPLEIEEIDLDDFPEDTASYNEEDSI